MAEEVYEIGMMSKQPGIDLARILTLAAIYIGLSLTILLNIRSIQPALHELLDFGSFIAAGTATAGGRNPYAVDSPLVYIIKSRETGQFLPSPNLNPPLSILFFTLLAHADPLKAVTSWRIVTAILFGIGVFILASAYPISRRPMQILWATSLAGFWNIILLGQIYAPILILAIGVWIFTERGDYKLAGLALGVIIAIKPNFVFWLFLLGAAGYITVALTAAIVAIVLSFLPVVILGPEIFKQWLTALSNYPAIGLLIAGNSSFQSLTARFGSALVGIMISLLFVSGSLFLALRYSLSLSKINALGIVGSLLISPFSWAGYTILTLPVFFSRSKWNWQYKLSAVILSVPYILILYYFQRSFFHSVLFGWLYGWGLLLILAGLILDKDNKLEELDVNSLSSVEAANKPFEWQKKFTK